jgi:group I intron endonuclease
MKGIIYCAESPEGKKYIGRSIQNLTKRKYKHYYQARNGSNLYFHNAIKKYGEENIKWSVIERLNEENREELIKKLNEREIILIKVNNTIFPYGYNLTRGGGNYGSGLSDREGKTYEEFFGEERAKKIKNQIKENNAHYWKGKKAPKEAVDQRAKSNTGKQRTEESKDKIRKALLGIKHTEERKKNNSEGHKKSLKFN